MKFTPQITIAEASTLPVAPRGWHYANLTNPSTLVPDPQHYPIVFIGPYTYTALTDDNNDLNMLIVGWDTRGIIIKQLEKPGARYLCHISFDSPSHTITFIGQYQNTVTASLEELNPLPVPLVTTADVSKLPRAPTGFDYVNLTDPDQPGGDDQHYPVLLYGSYTYTALTRDDNADEMVIVGWDSTKNLVKMLDKAGARYLWKITYDAHKDIVTFAGQARRSVSVSLDELISMRTYAPPHIINIKQSLLPTPPSGWEYLNTYDPAVIRPNVNCYPILLFGSYLYTALSKIDHTDNMLIVCWDTKKKLVKQIQKSGARCIYTITFDSSTQIVTFTGLNNKSVTTSLNELVILPSVIRLPASSGPDLPFILSYSAPNLDSFPVIQSGPYSFWAASYTDGRDAFCVVVVDKNNVILKLIDCPGGPEIHDIRFDHSQRLVTLEGKANYTGADNTFKNRGYFDYNTVMACFYSFYIVSAEDYLFLADVFGVSLTATDAMALAKVMPQVDCGLCCLMDGMTSDWPPEQDDTFAVGVFLSGTIGGFGGFMVGGSEGARPGSSAGSMTAVGIGPTEASCRNLAPFQISPLERSSALIGYNGFGCGPLYTDVAEDVFYAPLPRYGQLPYSAAVARAGNSLSPQAYAPLTGRIAGFPHDPRYPAVALLNGIKLSKYIFLIVRTQTITGDLRGFEMRILPQGFYPDAWPADQNINQAQLAERYLFWALQENNDQDVYSAGSLYVDNTNNKFVGISTRTGHFYRTLVGSDKVVNTATLGFLDMLGYLVRGLLRDADMIGYLKENLPEPSLRQ